MTFQTAASELHCASRDATSFSAQSIALPPIPASLGTIEVDLRLRHAGPRRVSLRYERAGNPALPVVLVAGGISSHRHVFANDCNAALGWWESQVGLARAIDPTKACVISFDWLGADGLLDAPIDPADQADAVKALLDALGVARLQAFVGCSYGAMVGLQFAALHGARLQQLVAISGTHRAHPYASAWRALQRRAIALGALQCDEVQGVALARQLALLSYRTPEEFDSRFGAASVLRGQVRVGAEDYLDHCGAAFAQRFSPVAYLRLSESIDLQVLDPAQVRVPVRVIAIAEDRLVPVADAYTLTEQLGGDTRLCVLRSQYGHDAFLKEHVAIDSALRDALRAETAVAA